MSTNHNRDVSGDLLEIRVQLAKGENFTILHRFHYNL